MIEFYEDPEKYPMTTPSGKLEFYSERLAKHFPDDMERPPVPHWIEKSDFHDERLSSERAKNYSLLVISNHPRWRVHAQMDDMNWFHEIETGKVKGPDGYHYEPAWIHPSEAEKRGIKNGDVVTIYNERGKVLCGAYVTERIMPGIDLCRPRRPLRPHRPGRVRPRRRHQHHLPAQDHLQELRRHGHQRLPGGGGDGPTWMR